MLLYQYSSYYKPIIENQKQTIFIYTFTKPTKIFGYEINVNVNNVNNVKKKNINSRKRAKKGKLWFNIFFYNFNFPIYTMRAIVVFNGGK